jgi:hypothetical protein
MLPLNGEKSPPSQLGGTYPLRRDYGRRPEQHPATGHEEFLLIIFL